MKRILALLFVSLFLIPYSFAQRKIAVVDIESTVNQWNRAVQLDYMLTEKGQALQKMVNTWLDKLQVKYEQYDNQLGTPTQQSELAGNILSGQEEILLFEQILVDSIPIYRGEVIQMIENQIQQTIDGVALANGYDLVIAKDNILFYRGKEIDELIVSHTDIDLKDIKASVSAIESKLRTWIEEYTERIEQY
ncbi:MAG: OmpH family outer membrane protein [Saprospiraceae bacterium]|nr:OmpH family outer membrane protein [Lewinella sp.]